MRKKSLILIMSVIIMLASFSSGINAFAASGNSPTIIVENAEGYAGDNIEVIVKLKNNPGITACTISLNYDDSKLQYLESAVGNTAEMGGSLTPSQPNSQPVKLVWTSSGTQDFIGDCMFATVKFHIVDGASQGQTSISATYDPYDVYNIADQNVTFEVVNGTVNIKSKAPAHSHNFVNGKVTKEPTCTAEGVKTYTCSCGDTQTETIPSTGHTAGDWETTVNPDCTNNGKKVQKCSVCKAELASEEIASLGHSFTNYVENGDGTKTAKCDNCDETNTVSSTTEVTLISYDEVKVSVAAGYTPNLPETVVAHYSDGTSKELAVLWATLGINSFMTPGTVVEIKGAALENGMPIPNINDTIVPTARVEVRAPLIVSVKNAKVKTVVGTAPVLPETITANLSNDTTAEIKVDWEAIDPASYTQTGKFTVAGAIDGNGSYAVAEDISLSLVCTVEVTEKQTEIPEEKPADKPTNKPADKPNNSDKPVNNNTPSNDKDDVVIENVQTGESSQAAPMLAFIVSSLTMALALAYNKFREINGNAF